MCDRRGRPRTSVVALVVVPLLALLATPAPATATAIYGYTGTDLIPPMFGLERAHGFLVFAEPLPPDMPLQNVKSLVTYSYFRDGGNVYRHGRVANTFLVRTNSAGDIVEWSFFVESFGSSGCQFTGPCQMWSNGSPTGGSDSVLMWDDDYPAGGGSSSSPGTWLTGVPEPSAALLALVGLGSLGAIRRRSVRGGGAPELAPRAGKSLLP